ncbi:glycoside hydrolase family 16 protein [Polychaeton citri CBS 116435]|uniref:Glycoside hydrolase family 16 protein n=1 Tax=Polychaeton citri CBS 116435 TaxID=1314669 RepID=A0A9P4USW2_9PEZI|nr:glycoside hydrolase family 16 protein [Polychaeton citri CBS 116435]
MDPNSPPDRHQPPHIRLNSGADDLLQMSEQRSAGHEQQEQLYSDMSPVDQSPPPQQETSQTRPQTARQPSTRSLTQASQARPGTAPNGALRTQASTSSVYQNQTPQESAELLLPPRKSRTRRFRDDEGSEMRSPSASGFNSRRTSWSSNSTGSRDSRYGGPFISPFDDSRAPSRAGSDDEGVNTQTVSEKYNILPSAGLLLFPEDVEKDDYLHNPDPNDRDKMEWADLFSSRGIANVGGLLLITLGLLVLFIGYPILTFAQQFLHPAGSNACELDPDCLDSHTPLLKNLRTGLIDPDTPDSVKTMTGSNGQTLTLAFSDEFNYEGRTFYDGDDPYFQGMDIWYGVTQDMEWYDPDAVTTKDGTLVLRFDAFQSHNLNYRSGMLQSWNKLCFKGGYLEASISLPGRGDTIGFWPGFWAMGNLGRPGYAATTDGMWPYSYENICDAGITRNQSNPDGMNYLPGMRLPACTCTGDDHPSPGHSRSAPEIDAIEASVTFMSPPSGEGIGSASQSFQVAPFDDLWRPNHNYLEVYDHRLSQMNAYQGSQYQQALSTVTNLNNDWYMGKAYQTYGFEYEPGGEGYITWYVGSEKTWKVDARSVGPNGNVGQRVMPEEPLSIVANFGMSSGFAELNLTGLGKLMPATMLIDYIRIYQDEDGEMTCDPEGYETTEYIANHPEAYGNPNLTHWSQTKHDWPKNSYVDGCEAQNYNPNKLIQRDPWGQRKNKNKNKKRSIGEQMAQWMGKAKRDS